MLGRFRRAGCGHFRCRMCGPGDTRRAKRAEQRDFAGELREALKPYHRILAELGPGDSSGEGDLRWLVDEIAEWEPLRKKATTVILGEGAPNERPV